MTLNSSVTNANFEPEDAHALEVREDNPLRVYANVPVNTRFSVTKMHEQSTCMVDQQEFERLQNQAKRLEQMLQIMPAGVVVIDGQGVVRQANTLARDLLGEPLEGQIWRQIIQRSFKPQADDGHEVSLRDGRKVKLSISPLVDEPGQMIVMTDLTETRQLQQRISHMQRLSSLGRTVASLVHQIRTPLSAAMLYASNLASDKLTEPARKRFNEKLQSRLSELEHQVNDMLLFAKSGEQQVLQTVSPDTLVNEVIQGADVMVAKHGAQLHLSSCIDPQTDVTLKLNLPAVVGACHNLIHNALQSGANRITLALEYHQEHQKRWLKLSVKDDGPGLQDESISQLFEPFYTTRSHGTGLGLAVVNSVAKSHQGEVRAGNNPEGGACFTLMLPAEHSKAPSAQDDINQNTYTPEVTHESD